MKQIAMFFGLAVAVLSPQVARADIWAYTDFGPGNQTGNSGILLAQTFTVNPGHSISVTNIGAFVNNRSSLQGNIEIAIVDAQGSVVLGTDTSFPTGTYTIFHGRDTYKPVSTNVTLGAGNYWLEALGYSVDPNGNTCSNCGFTGDPAPQTDGAGGVLSFSGFSAYTLPAGGFGVPATTDLFANGEPQYQIGTFSYTTPESGTIPLLLLFGSVIAVVGLVRPDKSRSPRLSL